MKTLLILALFYLPFSVSAQSRQYSIVFLNSRPDAEKRDRETEQKLFEAHIANINRLAKEGKLLAAGPFHRGGGIFILNTSSLSEAESWTNSDPGVQANLWNVEILPYTPRVGSVCPVSEPYEMVSYTFVRFNAIVEKFTAANYPSLVRLHDMFLKEKMDSLQVVTEAIFGPNEGGILVVRDDVGADYFSRDPGVQQGLIHVDVKKLYIARTSFCEE